MQLTSVLFIWKCRLIVHYSIIIDRNLQHDFKLFALRPSQSISAARKANWQTLWKSMIGRLNFFRGITDLQ